MREIYHYTDATALIGIIQYQTLWATHIYHLNDPNEYARPREIANNIGKEISFAAREEAHSELDYVFCFSEKKDDLNQFRSYGDDGKGYMISFDADKLISILGLSESKLEQIYYGEENYEPHLRKILLESKAAFEQDKAESANSNIPFSPSPYLNAVGSQIYFCKSNHYKEEAEVRLLIQGKDKFSTGALKYRAKSSRIVPFIELKPKTGILPITGVLIGPAHRNNEIDVLEGAIQDLCWTKYKFIPKVSQIDYRSSR
jgi:Protein of unknown function (DUF2971)